MIENVFQGKYSIPLLRTINSTPEGCTISEISKELKISKSVAFRMINYMKDENILISFSTGKKKLYKLNEENYFVKKIVKGMFELEEKTMKEVKNLITEKFKRLKVLSIILYGSFYTPNFNFKSDIDLMIIVENKDKIKKDIEKIINFFLDKGLILFVDLITIYEFKKLYKIKEPLIDNIIKNGVVLYGKYPMELV